MGALAPVRWGILGTGRMARRFAADLRRVADARLVAVGSREASRARGFADSLGVPRAHAEYAGLVVDPEVDIVYVATPGSEHRAHCSQALLAGKPVLCEKPFATSGADARAVVALARERGLFCMEAVWTRCLPLLARAEALVRAGEIGEPLAFQADFGVVGAGRERRPFRPELGGGALLDLGVYLLALARAFLGPVATIDGRALRGPTGVDEQVSILLEHAGGGHSLLLASLLSQTPAAAVVLGTRGRLTIHPPLYRPHRISLDRFAAVGEGRAEAEAIRATGAGWKALLRPWYQRFEGVLPLLARRPALALFEAVEGNGYQHEAAEAMRCLRAGELESPRMPLDETVAVADLMDQLRSRF